MLLIAEDTERNALRTLCRWINLCALRVYFLAFSAVNKNLGTTREIG
jgi:hypothetical protein